MAKDGSYIRIVASVTVAIARLGSRIWCINTKRFASMYSLIRLVIPILLYVYIDVDY